MDFFEKTKSLKKLLFRKLCVDSKVIEAISEMIPTRNHASLRKQFEYRLASRFKTHHYRGREKFQTSGRFLFERKAWGRLKNRELIKPARIMDKICRVPPVGSSLLAKEKIATDKSKARA